MGKFEPGRSHCDMSLQDCIFVSLISFKLLPSWLKRILMREDEINFEDLNAKRASPDLIQLFCSRGEAE